VYVAEPIQLDGTGSTDPNEPCDEIVQYEWDIDNDGTYDKSGPTVNHSYDTPGDYEVQLRVTDSFGATDTLDVPLEIQVSTEYFDPVADGYADPNPASVCEDVTLDGSASYDPDGGDIVEWAWDLDNDGTFDVTGETYITDWDTPGNKSVNLRVTDDEGATDTLDTLIVVEVVNDPPTAVAESDLYDVFVAEPIQLDGTGSTDPNEPCDEIVQYEWDIDNDGTYDKSGPTVNHSYDSPGVYEVQLRVTDTFGATDTLDTPLEITVSIEYFDPIAYADASPNPQTVCEDVNLFDDGSYDPDGGNIVEWEWDIGNDGSYEYTGSSVYHSWDTPGTYYVNLRVTDDEGAMDTLDTPLSIEIQNALPTAVAEANKYVAYVDELIDFDGSGSYDNDCNGTITDWEWDWDDNGTYDDTGEFASHSYSAEGTYYVDLRVTDDEVSTDELDVTLEIEVVTEPIDPVADATADPNPQTICLDVHFDGSASYDPDGGNIVLYEWDIDDDDVYEFTGVTLDYSWDTPGTYDVDLRVTDDEGATDTLDTVLQIEIENALPTAVAEVDNDNPTICVEFTLDGSDSHDNDCNGEIVSYEWDLDDDGLYDDASGPYVNHSFDTPGIYDIDLKVTDDEGGIDTLNTVIRIDADNALPTAVADADKFVVYIDEMIDFDGSGSYDNDCNGSIDQWEWDWDYDGFNFTTDDTGEFASHSYSTEGVYEVNLRVTDDENSTDTLDTLLEITVEVEKLPPIAYATADPNPQTICLDVTLEDDGSYDPDGGLIVLYEWDIGNNGSWDFTGDTLLYSWDTPGTYYVNFRVTDDEGETDELDTPLSIEIQNALPTAVGSVDTNTGDTDYNFEFDGSASHDNDCQGAIDLYEWDFDYDGSNFTTDDTGAVVYNTYAAPGVYDVMLRVTDDENGQDLLDQPIQITVTSTECLSGIHEYTFAPDSERGLSNHYSTFAYSVLPRADIAYIESGSMAGLAIVQGGPNSLVTFDPDVDDLDPINDSVMKKPTGGAAGAVLTTVLDGAPYDSMVAVVTSDKPYELRLLDSSVIAGNFFPFAKQFNANDKIMAVDFAANGDIFVVTTNDTSVYLQKGTYVGDPDFYLEEDWEMSPITVFVGDEIDIFDIAVNWSNDLIYLFDAGNNGRGRVSVFDSSTFALVQTVQDIYDSAIDFESNVASGASGYADIEIDHIGPDELCHIFLYARFNSDSAELRKYDDTMNMVDVAHYQGQPWPSMTINPNSLIQDRDITAPGQAKLGFWFADTYQ